MRDNINIILCEKTDKSLTNIYNIIDVVPLQHDGTISFDIVVFVNGIEWDVNNFGLYFFVEALDRKKIKYLGSSEYQYNAEHKTNTHGNYQFGSKRNSSQSISEYIVKDLDVLGEGSYELQVYKYENEDMVDLSEMGVNECIEYAKDENLVAAYSFEVAKIV